MTSVEFEKVGGECRVRKCEWGVSSSKRQVASVEFENLDGLVSASLFFYSSRFSYVAEHSKDSGHNIDWFNVKIITRDNITIKRLIKETLAISSLNLK